MDLLTLPCSCRCCDLPVRFTRCCWTSRPRRFGGMHKARSHASGMQRIDHFLPFAAPARTAACENSLKCISRQPISKVLSHIVGKPSLAPSHLKTCALLSRAYAFHPDASNHHVYLRLFRFLNRSNPL